MAVVAWVMVGAIAGLLAHQVAGRGAPAYMAVVGGMIGALATGTAMLAASGSSSIGAGTVATAIVLIAAAVGLGRYAEDRRRGPRA